MHVLLPYRLLGALSVFALVFVASPGEARSPWVEARIDQSTLSEGEVRMVLWSRAHQMLRQRSAFPWEVDRVRRSISRAPLFRSAPRASWVTQLQRQSGCLIGSPIVTDPSCRQRTP